MKLVAIIFLTACVTLPGFATTRYLTNSYDHISTSNGTEYERVTFQRLEGQTLVFIHKAGIGKIHYSLFPDDVLSDLGLPTTSERNQMKEDRAKAEKKRAEILAAEQESQREALLNQISKAKKEIKDAHLVLLDWNWSVAHGYATVEGQVGNLTSRKLENVQAVANFYADDGTFIASDSVLIEYNPIMPGQVSPFEVIQKHNPLMKKASISFKQMFGTALTSIDKKTYELAIMKDKDVVEQEP